METSEHRAPSTLDNQGLAPSSPIQKMSNLLARDGSGLLHRHTPSSSVLKAGRHHVILRKDQSLPHLPLPVGDSQAGRAWLQAESFIQSAKSLGKGGRCVGAVDILGFWHILGSFILVENFYGLHFP